MVGDVDQALLAVEGNTMGVGQSRPVALQQAERRSFSSACWRKTTSAALCWLAMKISLFSESTAMPRPLVSWPVFSTRDGGTLPFCERVNTCICAAVSALIT